MVAEDGGDGCAKDEFATLDDVARDAEQIRKLVKEENQWRKKGATIDFKVKGRLTPVREPITLNNVSCANLWDRWFHGYQVTKDYSLPPFRSLHDKDFKGPSIRKARKVMEKLMREVVELKVLKKGQHIVDLEDEVEEILRNQAIEKAYQRAKCIRRTIGKDYEQGAPALSMSFTTFYDYVTIESLLNEYTKTHPYDEPAF